MKYTVLDNSEHRDLRRKRGTLFYLKEQATTSLSVVEAPRAALDLPLAFGRDGEGRLQLLALLSLGAGDNVQIGPMGLWLGGYIPAVIRTHPFLLSFRDDRPVVMVAEESDWLSTSEGRPLFGPLGGPTKLLNKITRLLRTRCPNPTRDTPILELIDRSGILSDWSALAVPNLMRVDPQKLADLDNEIFTGLRRHEALAVIYAQLFSIPRLNRLKTLARRKEKMAERQLNAKGVPADLGLIFDDDDDLIKFDFD